MSMCTNQPLRWSPVIPVSWYSCSCGVPSMLTRTDLDSQEDTLEMVVWQGWFINEGAGSAWLCLGLLVPEQASCHGGRPPSSPLGTSTCWGTLSGTNLPEIQVKSPWKKILQSQSSLLITTSLIIFLTKISLSQNQLNHSEFLTHKRQKKEKTFNF